MSSTRVSVEWLFGASLIVSNVLALKIQLSSFGEIYIVCILLKNARNCLYGSSTSDLIQIDPPNIEEYFK